jgi:S1-C subfamily serine protease
MIAWIAASLVVGWAAPAVAQDKADDRTKRILERIEKEIQDSHTKLLEDIRQIIRQELKGGARATPPAEARKPYLGITLDDLSDDDRKSLGITGGVKISDVRGPAEKAGLKPGDILLDMDGEAVTEERLPELMAKYKPGDAVAATVLRATRKKESVKIVLGER